MRRAPGCVERSPSRHGRVSLALPLVLLLVACAPKGEGVVGSPPGVAFAGHPPNEFYQACGYGRVALSPDGALLAAMDPGEGLKRRDWRVHYPAPLPDRLAVADTDCMIEKGGLSGCHVGTFELGPFAEGVQAYWSLDSRHVFARAQATIFGVFEVDRAAKSVRPVGRPIDHPFALYDNLAIIGPTPSREVGQEIERINAARKRSDALLRAWSWNDRFGNVRMTLRTEGMSAEGALHDSLELGSVGYDGSSDIERTGFSVMVFGGDGFSRPSRVLDVTGRPWLAGSGEALVREASPDGAGWRWRSGPRPGLYGKRPIYESATGRLLGVHTETEIEWVTVDPLLESLREAILDALPAGATLHEVQVAKAAGKAVVLHYDLRTRGAHMILKRDDGDDRWNASGSICDDHDPQQRAVRSARTYDAGEPGWPVLARFYGQTGSRQLVVYLHGGPSPGVLYDASWNPHHPSWRGIKSDVVTYDPSGTIGVDAAVAQRLAAVGGAALERDARLIVRDVRRLAGRYDEVVLIATSFGGMLAPDVARGLDDRLSRAYLFVPAARMRRASELGRHVTENTLKGVSTSFSQLQLDHHMGLKRTDGQPNIDDWLKARYESFRPDQRFLIVFGRFDDLSRPEDVPHRHGARVVVIDADHRAPTYARADPKTGGSMWIWAPYDTPETRAGLVELDGFGKPR